MDDIKDLLPLSRSLLHLLLAIHEGERHGYAVKQHVEERSGGIVRMGPGTLYTTIAKAEDLGLIVESEDRPPEDEDHPQRKYYELTPMGERALSAEVERIGAFIDHARTALGGAGGK